MYTNTLHDSLCYDVLSTHCVSQHSYLNHHLVARDPFKVLDEGGVGSLVVSCVQRARQANTGVKVSCAVVAWFVEVS